MSEDKLKRDLLEDFRIFLEQKMRSSVCKENAVGQGSYIRDISELKMTVREQTRLFNQSLDLFKSTITSLQQNNEVLLRQVSEHDLQLQELKHQIIKSIFLEILENYDRLDSGLSTLNNYRPIRTLFKRSRDRDIRLIKSLQQGQLMSVKRIEQLMLSYQITPMECIGKLFDPISMIVVETGCDPQFENGVVVKEFRKGFLYRDQVLRLAEVKVNKT